MECLVEVVEDARDPDRVTVVQDLHEIQEDARDDPYVVTLVQDLLEITKNAGAGDDPRCGYAGSGSPLGSGGHWGRP